MQSSYPVGKVYQALLNNQHIPSVIKQLGDQRNNHELIILFTLLLQNGKNGVVFHQTMIPAILKHDLFKNIKNISDLFSNLKPLHQVIFDELLATEKAMAKSTNDDTEIDEQSLHKKVSDLLQKTAQNLQNLQLMEIKEEKKIECPIKVNFVWIKLSQLVFPDLKAKKSYITNGNSTFEQLFNQENIPVLKDWMKEYGEKNVNIWLDSRLLSPNEFKILATNLQKLGVQVKDVATEIANDQEINSIPNMIKQEIEENNFKGVGYIIDLIKFKAAYHSMKNNNMIYIHSDFDYAPLPNKIITSQAGKLGFKTSWKTTQLPENDLFIIDPAHKIKYPDLLEAMNDMHKNIMKNKLYKKYKADGLFSMAYQQHILKILKDHKEKCTIDSSLIVKHKNTAGNYRTWG